MTILEEPVESLVSRPGKGEARVLHFGRIDILTREGSLAPEEEQSLISIFRGGMPEDWVEHSYGDVFFDSSSTPRYVAKVRRVYSARALVEVKAATRDSLDWRTELAMHSLLAEFNLSPKIGKVVSSGRAREIITRYGFNTLRYPEPLLGVVDRRRQEKIRVRRYVPGRDLYDSHCSADECHDMTHALGDLFRNFGIEPGDFGPGQFLADGKDLYLIDAEAFASRLDK